MKYIWFLTKKRVTTNHKRLWELTYPKGLNAKLKGKLVCNNKDLKYWTSSAKLGTLESALTWLSTLINFPPTLSVVLNLKRKIEF